MEKATVGPQGRIVIPARVRRALELEPGTVLSFTVRDDEAIVSTPRSALRRLQSLFETTEHQGSASDELIAERRAEASREDD